ncbi:AraC family transcriptional regulator [Flavobacterium sp. LS1R47]|jgi:AraC-like DNA-binding protein|uniref:AraC family transcriptional regulator n=1 Tax=Flavobacterium frigoritolerans TaxID=2987686 RepID=A0A9X3C825_9FLAO|nr:AraC family transcriptional regulator [Flavobacterium frigoritolerans]MCV9932802.1 AraC family transcriptional regulator [Flavobacterium frigoritolerans]
MKKITHHYGVELDWVAPLTKQLEGKVDGNFILVPDHIHTGVRYFLNCDFGISVLYLDVLYNTEIHFRQENKTDDFIGIYYNLTEGEAIFVSDDLSNSIGRWNYNLAFVDSSLCHDYIVKSGSKVFTLCIFIKKEVIKGYLQKNPFIKDHADDMFNPELNTIVKFTIMSNESYNLLMNLRAHKPEEASFELHLRGTVQNLLAEYIEKMVFDEIVVDTVNENDLANIIQSQAYLIENLNDTFPSIIFLAQQSNMSVSKYKILFKKITGSTPNAFFLNNKLLESKRLLQEQQLTISQISTELNFANSSYFAAKFKELFGMTPKNFIKKLQ